METVVHEHRDQGREEQAERAEQKLVPQRYIPKFFPSKTSIQRRKGDYAGVILAAVGASILGFIAFWEVINPENRTFYWLTVLGLATLAVFTGLLTVSPAIIAARSNAADRKEHDALKDRLAPTLFAGMEEIVDRWSEYLLPGLQLDSEIEIDEVLELELHVFLRINGHYRIVASSAEPYSYVRRLKLDENEGLIHLVYARNAAVVARVESDFHAKLLNPHGREIADQPPLRDTNAEKCDPNLKWIYATPIFDHLKHRPWSDRTLGVLSVDGLYSASGDLFLKPEFRDLVEAVALQLAPYVSACESLRVLPPMPLDE